MLGTFDEVLSFEAFSAALGTTSNNGGSYLEYFTAGMVHVLETFGLPLFVGCIPWSILVGVLTYLLATRIVTRGNPSQA